MQYTYARTFVEIHVASHLTNSNYKSEPVSAVQVKKGWQVCSIFRHLIINHSGFTGFNTIPATLELIKQF